MPLPPTEEEMQREARRRQRVANDLHSLRKVDAGDGLEHLFGDTPDAGSISQERMARKLELGHAFDCFLNEPDDDFSDRPRADDIADNVLEPLAARRRTLVRKRGQARTKFKAAAANEDRAAKNMRANWRNTPSWKEACVILSNAQRALAACEAAIAAHDAMVETRRREIEPFVQAAIAGTGKWRLKNGRPLDDKGRYVNSFERRYWETLE